MYRVPCPTQTQVSVFWVGRQIQLSLTLSAGLKFLCFSLPGAFQTREAVVVFKGSTVLVTSVISMEVEKPTTTAVHLHLSEPKKKASSPPGSIPTSQGDLAPVPDIILITIPNTRILAKSSHFSTHLLCCNRRADLLLLRGPCLLPQVHRKLASPSHCLSDLQLPCCR